MINYWLYILLIHKKLYIRKIWNTIFKHNQNIQLLFWNTSLTNQLIMKFSIEKKEQYTLFTLDEENLNSIIAPLLKSEFIIYRNEGLNNFILDLSNVKFVDSSGLSAILTANRLWKGFGSFVITGIDYPSVKKID